MSANGEGASPQGPAVLIVGAGFGGLGCAKDQQQDGEGCSWWSGGTGR